MDSTTDPKEGQVLHSWQLVRIINNYSPLTAVQTRILMFLADHANREKGWKAWPSVDLIAERVHLCRDTVIQAIKEIERAGYLRKERIKAIPPRNDYFLNVDAISSMKSTNNGLTDLYKSATSTINSRPNRPLNVGEVDPIRLSSSDYDHHAKNEQASVSLRLSDASCDAVYVKKRPLTDSQVQQIFEAIDPYLIQTLTKIELVTMGKDAPTYSDQLRCHIKWREPDLDWESICFTVAKGWIEGTGKEYAVRCPSALTFTVADNPHLYDGVVYSSKELDRLIRSYNAKMSA